MRRSGVIALLATLLVGGVVLTIAAGKDRPPLADSLGVQVQEPVATLRPGSEACQGPLQVAKGVRVLRWVFNTGAAEKPGPPLKLEVRRRGTVLRQATVPAGYHGIVDVGLKRPIPDDRLVTLCVHNEGQRAVSIYGSDPAGTGPLLTPGAGRYGNSTSALSVDGRTVTGDAFIDFPSSGSSSLLDRLTSVPSRASAWLPRPLGTWFLFLLAAATLLAASAGMVVALRAALAADAP